MSDQATTTPGLRDVVATDAARLPEQDPWRRAEAKGTAFAGQARRPLTAEWLRSPTAYRELMRHHLTDVAGRCGCGEGYTSHARHILAELARVAEEG